MSLQEKIAAIKAARAESGTTVAGSKKLPAKRKGKKLIPLFKEYSDYVPTEAEELRGSCEDFLHTFSPEMSLLQQMVFDGKAKHFEGSSGLIVKTLTDMYEEGILFPAWPKQAIIPPIAWYILTESTKWDKKTEEEILPDLADLGINFKKIARPTFEKPPVAGESTASPATEDDEDEDDEE